MKLSFEKYEGLGNDFLVVDERGLDLDDATVRRLCDRHYGIGADGVLIVAGSTKPELAGSMVVRNADGSRPEMCGNGLRCAALYLVNHGGTSLGQPAAELREGGLASLMIVTDAGPRRCEVSGESVTVDMGAVRGSVQPMALEVQGERVEGWNVNMGNPHTVIFVPDAKLACDRLGLVVATHARFADGTNAGFVHLIDSTSLDLCVWERGVGPTLACGTGACAAAVASCCRGTSPYHVPISVRLPGGSLHITVNADLDVTMTGPAHHVFSGEVSI